METLAKCVRPMESDKEKKYELDLSSPDKKIFVDENGFAEIDGIKVPYFREKFQSLRKYETVHDVPCPSGMGEKVADDHYVNEWVFNHLPLKEDEKKAMLHDLRKECITTKRGEIVQEGIKEELEKTKKERKEKRKTRERGGVKDTH